MGKGHVCRKDMRQFPIMLCGKYYRKRACMQERHAAVSHYAVWKIL